MSLNEISSWRRDTLGRQDQYADIVFAEKVSSWNGIAQGFQLIAVPCDIAGNLIAYALMIPLVIVVAPFK